jgi:glutaredoxin
MQVKVYGSNREPYTEMLRNILKYNNIEFENLDTKDPKNMREMVEKSGQNTTPVMEVDGKIFIGFDREKIREVLGIK